MSYENKRDEGIGSKLSIEKSLNQPKRILKKTKKGKIKKNIFFQNIDETSVDNSLSLYNYLIPPKK